jgi:hypothetical protein
MSTGAVFFENLINLDVLDLNLSNNKLSDLAIKYLTKSLIKSLVKIRLMIDSCGITEKGCRYIGRLISFETGPI